MDDGTIWGSCVANGVRRRLSERGVPVAMDATFAPGEADYSARVSKLEAAGVDLSFPAALPGDGPDLPPGARPGLRSQAGFR